MVLSVNAVEISSSRGTCRGTELLRRQGKSLDVSRQLTNSIHLFLFQLRNDFGNWRAADVTASPHPQCHQHYGRWTDQAVPAFLNPPGIHLRDRVTFAFGRDAENSKDQMGLLRLNCRSKLLGSEGNRVNSGGGGGWEVSDTPHGKQEGLTHCNTRRCCRRQNSPRSDLVRRDQRIYLQRSDSSIFQISTPIHIPSKEAHSNKFLGRFPYSLELLCIGAHSQKCVHQAKPTRGIPVVLYPKMYENTCVLCISPAGYAERCVYRIIASYFVLFFTSRCPKDVMTTRILCRLSPAAKPSTRQHSRPSCNKCVDVTLSSTTSGPIPETAESEVKSTTAGAYSAAFQSCCCIRFELFASRCSSNEGKEASSPEARKLLEPHVDSDENSLGGSKWLSSSNVVAALSICIAFTSNWTILQLERSDAANLGARISNVWNNSN
eukprot:284816985_2